MLNFAVQHNQIEQQHGTSAEHWLQALVCNVVLNLNSRLNGYSTGLSSYPYSYHSMRLSIMLFSINLWEGHMGTAKALVKICFGVKFRIGKHNPEFLKNMKI